ncbi:unnamed protein product [Heterobilharzia americana]|nr:unnamed protein product [Heterobilharzia americana]
MQKVSALCISVCIVGLLTTTICEDADLFDKRATLSYFKRDGELTDSSSEPSSSSKRASLSYFKRGQNEYWQTSPHHLRRIAEICPCLRKDYLEWLEGNSLSHHHSSYDDSSASEKRASLAYFKRKMQPLD